jgi:RimJ/RimL family protein N-acetyltransferase
MLGPTLVGSTVTLARLRPEHLEHYLEWFADPEVTRFLMRDTPPSLKEEEEWLERVARSETELLWGLFVQGEHIGGTGISGISWRSRHGLTGTMIGDRRWWGRGIATEAMGMRTRYAFEELGLEKLVTQVFEGNVASRRALERVGYQTVGVRRHHEYRHGQWWDVWLGELLRDDWLRRQSTPEGIPVSRTNY